MTTDDPPPVLPRVTITNRQRPVALSFLPRLRRFADTVLPGCLANPGDGETVLAGLAEVGVVLVSDRVSARLHQQFMGVAGPTDVITFMHGEIVIGTGVAQRQAQAHRQTLERELCRYIVHGLLHLNGHEDERPEPAAMMWRVQERLLRGAGNR